jgi:oligoribonuclease
MLDSTTRKEATVTEEVDDVQVVWVDLEMTGLDPVEDYILEVGFRVTNWDGSEEVARWSSLVHNAGWRERLNLGDNRPALEIHTVNGLIQDLEATEKVDDTMDVREAESVLLGWLDDLGVTRGATLFGSSNSLDRYFLIRHMPQLASFFTYRTGDTSAVREFMRVTSPDLFAACEAQFEDRVSAHRVQRCIDNSIELYQWLIDNYFHN